MYKADASRWVKRTKIVYAHVLSSRPHEATGRANPDLGAGTLPLFIPPRCRHIACPGEAWSALAAVGSPRPLAPGGGACRLLGTERGIAAGRHDGADRRRGKRWWHAATTSVEVVALGGDCPHRKIRCRAAWPDGGDRWIPVGFY
jgi:hypothetical protein